MLNAIFKRIVNRYYICLFISLSIFSFSSCDLVCHAQTNSDRLEQARQQALQRTGQNSSAPSARVVRPFTGLLPGGKPSMSASKLPPMSNTSIGSKASEKTQMVQRFRGGGTLPSLRSSPAILKQVPRKQILPKSTQFKHSLRLRDDNVDLSLIAYNDVETESTVKANQTNRQSVQDELKKDSHLKDWKQLSYSADQLIDHGKFDQAEVLLTNILPTAKREAPESPDYALTLCRLGTVLYAQKKYSQSLNRLEEAMSILQQPPNDNSQCSIMWRCMGTKIAVLLSQKKNAEAETLASKTLAYAITFPDVATPKQVKIAYGLLANSLEAQGKADEASKIKEIMNQ